MPELKPMRSGKSWDPKLDDGGWGPLDWLDEWLFIYAGKEKDEMEADELAAYDRLVKVGEVHNDLLHGLKDAVAIIEAHIPAKSLPIIKGSAEYRAIRRTITKAQG